MEKKIFLKFGLVFFSLIIFNFIYTKWFYQDDIQEYSDIINLVNEIHTDADILYIGESSNITFRNDDLDKRPISDFIGDFYPDLNTYDITKPASHAGIYKVLLENVPIENQTKTLIVTLNLRSFNAQWIFSKLETELQKSLVLIQPYPPLINRFLLSFKAYDVKTEQERMTQVKSKWEDDQFVMPDNFDFENVIQWDQWMAKTGIRNSKNEFDYKATELACHYIKAYGFQLDTIHNPRIADFNDIIKLAKERNWNLVFNLLAENTQKAEKLVGHHLISMMNRNAELLKEYFEAKGVTVINNLHAVDDEQFIDQNWTTEHYAEFGRKTIALHVADGIRKWHETQFVAVNYDQKYQTRFFNDCDHDLIWGQMHTIVDEVSKSGNKSSKTGKGNDFGLTLEYPLNIIPDSLKNELSIDLYFMQGSLNHDAKLVVQALGDSIDSYWNGVELKESSSKVNKWEHFQQNIQLPAKLKKADLIKVYVYNPSEELIYIDDMKIEIK